MSDNDKVSPISGLALPRTAEWLLSGEGCAVALMLVNKYWRMATSIMWDGVEDWIDYCIAHTDQDVSDVINRGNFIAAADETYETDISDEKVALQFFRDWFGSHFGQQELGPEPIQRVILSLREGYLEKKFRDTVWDDVNEVLMTALQSELLFCDVLQALMNNSHTGEAALEAALDAIRQHLKPAVLRLEGQYLRSPDVLPHVGRGALVEIGPDNRVNLPEAFQLRIIDAGMVPIWVQSIERKIEDKELEPPRYLLASTLCDSYSRLAINARERSLCMTRPAWQVFADKVRLGLESFMQLSRFFVRDPNAYRYHKDAILDLHDDSVDSVWSIRLLMSTLVSAACGFNISPSGAEPIEGDARSRKLKTSLEGRLLMAGSIWTTCVSSGDPAVSMVLGGSILECLFMDSGSGEISKTLAQRLAAMLEPEGKHRHEAFTFLKGLYDRRSRIAHGSSEHVSQDELHGMNAVIAASMLGVSERIRQLEAMGYEAQIRDKKKTGSPESPAVFIEELDRAYAGAVSPIGAIHLDFIRLQWAELRPSPIGDYLAN